MKVIFATATFPPEVSGQASFVAALADRLSTQGVSVAVVTYGEPREVNLAFEVYWIRRTATRHWRYAKKLWQLSRNADLVYAHDLFSSGFPAALLKRRAVKLVLRLGGDFVWERMVNLGYTEAPLSEYYQRPKNVLEKLYLVIYRFVLKRADCVIFNTAWQKQLYQRVFSLHPKLTQVVENPYLADEDTTDLSKTVSGRGDEIIFAGRFIRVKNLRRLLAAFAGVETEKKLVLLGDGPMAEKLRVVAAEDPRVRIEPPLPRQEFLQRLSQSYLAVLPSLSELSPNFALEALSLQKPVILTRETGFSEELKQHCYLVDPLSLESIRSGIRYYLDEDNYQRQVSQLKQFRPTSTWQQVADQHLELFNSLVYDQNMEANS